MARTMMRCVLAAVGGAFVLALSFSDATRAQRSEPYGGFNRGPSPYGQPRIITQPGRFDYYVLSMSWSPSYCASLQRDRYDPQCHRRDGKRYSFVLHGLWPQFERGWPQDCPSNDRGFVPRPVAERMLDIMPNEKLVFHEYRKHGTCSGLGVDGYFSMSRKLFESVKIPERYRAVNDPRLFVSPSEVVKDFLSVNPELRPDSIAVECGGPGNRLREVRICFDRDGKTRACGRNEDQRKLCSADRVYMPPVRESAASSSPPESAPPLAPRTTAPNYRREIPRNQQPLPLPGERRI
jgi:ribonuclease T2